ncbi:MAG: DNA polymerase IV [Candidatus Promineifilaceae bacterium]|nr:DNA polymerase IV [Candidatus Promineifilaceae bacterium]
MSAKIWNRAILHLDMDAFYVNVHILDHPHDANIPLVVGGRPDQRGVVTSASYEARGFGVRSAMPTGHALRLCPQLKIVPADWSRIHECSRQIMALLNPFGPVEKMSVDEAYIDLSAHDNPQAIALEIKSSVKTETALPCSVGLASNKLVAKIASDHDKPDGFTVIAPGCEAEFMSPLPTRAIWGIGPQTSKRLAAQGIQTCGQLAQADARMLQKYLGRQAGDLVLRAQGIDNRPVQSSRGTAKSISQEWTFSKDIDNAIVLSKQLQKMCAKVAQSLQKKNLIAHTVTVKIRWTNFATITRQKSVSVGIDQEEDIWQLANTLWRDNWHNDDPIRLLGVGVSNLEQAHVRQLGFDFGANDS